MIQCLCLVFVQGVVCVCMHACVCVCYTREQWSGGRCVSVQWRGLRSPMQWTLLLGPSLSSCHVFKNWDVTLGTRVWLNMCRVPRDDGWERCRYKLKGFSLRKETNGFVCMLVCVCVCVCVLLLLLSCVCVCVCVPSVRVGLLHFEPDQWRRLLPRCSAGGGGAGWRSPEAGAPWGGGGHRGTDERRWRVVVRRSVLQRASLKRRRLTEEAGGGRGRRGTQQRRRLGERWRSLGGGGGRGAVGSIWGKVLHFDLRGGRGRRWRTIGKDKMTWDEGGQLERRRRFAKTRQETITSNVTCDFWPASPRPPLLLRLRRLWSPRRSSWGPSGPGWWPPARPPTPSAPRPGWTCAGSSRRTNSPAANEKDVFEKRWRTTESCPVFKDTEADNGQIRGGIMEIILIP